MSKNNETVASAISRLIRCAFDEAKIGNDGKARGLWADAIKRGYEPHPKTAKGFELAVEKGLRETRR